MLVETLWSSVKQTQEQHKSSSGMYQNRQEKREYYIVSHNLKSYILLVNSNLKWQDPHAASDWSTGLFDQPCRPLLIAPVKLLKTIH